MFIPFLNLYKKIISQLWDYFDLYRLDYLAKHYANARRYYDDRAELQLYPYSEGWDQVIEKFGRAIEKNLAPFLDFNSPLNIHDCTCGIGTQAIAMATRGHIVSASDCSERMITLARKYALERGAAIDFFLRDLRDPLSDHLYNKFDLVMSINNSLVFISNEDDSSSELLTCFQEIKKSLLPGGCFVVSLRPYDEYLISLPTHPPNRSWEFKPFGEKMVRFRQRYKWAKDLKHYTCYSHYDFIEKSGHRWSRTESIKVRAWTNSEITSALEKAGLEPVYSEVHRSKLSHYCERWIIAKNSIS